MQDKLCPLKVELTNDRYYCIGADCAWWVEVNEGSLPYGVIIAVGRCAITQLAITINCEVQVSK